MGIGAGIFLIAVGAILTFAVHANLSGVSVQTIGVILMVAGALGIVLDLALFAPRRRRVYTDGDYAAPATRRTVTRTDVY